MNAVILGNGYISGYLSKMLCEANSVTVCPRSMMDYGNKYELSKFLTHLHAEIVICAFGFTGKPNIDEAEEKKSLCWQLNVIDPLVVNTVCSDLDISFCAVSSGCIYNGYEKVWGKEDSSNFGLFHESSFYSKSKHAFETVTSHLPGTVIRIRLPFSGCSSSRNYLQKLLGYPSLIDMRNSRTSVHDLCSVVEASLEMMVAERSKSRRIMQVVNPDPLTTREVLDLMRFHGFSRDDWKFIPLDNLPAKAPRSNCLLQVDAGPFGHLISTEMVAMEKSLRLMTQNVK